mgnify:CR=1 FL=1
MIRASVCGAALVAAAVAGSGWLMDPVQHVTMTVELAANVPRVYQLVADPAQPWRTDLQRVEVRDRSSWVEVPSHGAPVSFRRTVADEGRRFAVSFSGEGFHGTWDGRFEPAAPGRSRLTFTESVTVPSPWLRPLSRLFFGPDRAMRRYVADLEQAVRSTGGV